MPDSDETVLEAPIEKPPDPGFVLPKGTTHAADDAFVVEDVEELPYDSIFSWDLNDCLGFYGETRRYQELKEEFKSDKLKVDVIDGMWRDRERYQVLRRFLWPPPILAGLFYSRGYYEDYEPRPSHNIAAMTASKARQEEELRLQKTKGYRWMVNYVLDLVRQSDLKHGRYRKNPKDMPTPPPLIVDQKSSLAEFDPEIYDRTVLVIHTVPEGVTKEDLMKWFPKGVVTWEVNETTGRTSAEIQFKDEKDSSEAFQTATKAKLRNIPRNVLPKLRRGVVHHADYHRHFYTGHVAYKKPDVKSRYMVNAPPPPPPSPPKPERLDRFGRKIPEEFNAYEMGDYDFTQLIISNIPPDTTSWYLYEKFPIPRGRIKMLPSKKTGELRALLTFDEPQQCAAIYTLTRANNIIKGFAIEVHPKRISQSDLRKSEFDLARKSQAAALAAAGRRKSAAALAADKRRKSMGGPELELESFKPAATARKSMMDSRKSQFNFRKKSDAPYDPTKGIADDEDEEGGAEKKKKKKKGKVDIEEGDEKDAEDDEKKKSKKKKQAFLEPDDKADKATAEPSLEGEVKDGEKKKKKRGKSIAFDKPPEVAESVAGTVADGEEKATKKKKKKSIAGEDEQGEKKGKKKKKDKDKDKNADQP